MTQFKPVRRTGNSEIPIRDGQLLIDYKKGTVAIDVESSRRHAQYIYGITKSVDYNTWVPVDGTYYINVTELVSDELPGDHMVVGASLMSGSTKTYTSVTDNVVKLYANDRVPGAILVFALASSGYTSDYAVNSLIALYHFEETSGAMIDSLGNTVISEDTGWVPYTECRYGSGSLCKSSVGYVEISNVPELSAFTIEWWQYDPVMLGDGGVILQGDDGLALDMVPISSSSHNYKYQEWKHVAISKKVDGPAYIYVNGTLVGFVHINEPIEGRIMFYGTGSADGNNKLCYIDELAIFNYSRYNAEFNVPDTPYIGPNEARIAVYGDLHIKGSSGDNISVDLPVNVPDGIYVEYDTSDITRAMSNVSVSNGTLTGTLLDEHSDVYTIVVRSPGVLSKVIKVSVTNTNDIPVSIYYGHMALNSITSITDDTIKTFMTSMEPEEGTVSINNVPAGEFIVLLIPDNSGLLAYKGNGLGSYIEFDPDAIIVGSGANGSIIDISGVEYRVYGELNIVEGASYTAVVTSGYINTDAIYVNDNLYTVSSTGEDASDTEWTVADDASNPTTIVESENEELNGVYILDESTNTWSK